MKVLNDGRALTEHTDNRSRLMFEAVSWPDPAAVHTLITYHRATADDVFWACEQAGVAVGELNRLYTDWLNATAAAVRAGGVNDIRLILGQPSLLAATAHFPQEEAH